MGLVFDENLGEMRTPADSHGKRLAVFAATAAPKWMHPFFVLAPLSAQELNVAADARSRKPLWCNPCRCVLPMVSACRRDAVLRWWDRKRLAAVARCRGSGDMTSQRSVSNLCTSTILVSSVALVGRRDASSKSAGLRLHKAEVARVTWRCFGVELDQKQRGCRTTRVRLLRLRASF